MSFRVHVGLAMEENNKTKHSMSVERAFPGFPGGFHVLLNAENETESAFSAGCKG